MKITWLCVVVVLIALTFTDAAMVNNTCLGASQCKKGVLLPLWEPVDNLSSGDKAARAIVYFASLVFMFLGVSIIADRFMAAIEVITSKEKEVPVKLPNGETTVVSMRIWNETVSNLTLMALGSSAPEILLSIIEICGNKFEAGDLGPSTIVGSAAFNLFVIIAICVYVIPDDEVRRIKHLRVFFLTATWSVFAYLWMYVIISVISPGEVEVWEGVLTFMFFPLTVGSAYVADRRIFFYKFLSKRYRASLHNKSGVVIEGDVEMDRHANHTSAANGLDGEIVFKGLDNEDAEIREFEKHRKDFIEILRELRKKHPNMDMRSLEEMAEYEAMNKGPKSRAFYRIQATRKLTGGGNIIKKSKIEQRKSSLADVKMEAEDDDVVRVFFEPGHYTVMENVGTFALTVSRQGGDSNCAVYVDYQTEDGTANGGSDYEHAQGTLKFQPGETHVQFELTIIDDDIFEEDEHFYVRLSNLRLGEPGPGFSGDMSRLRCQLANPSMATVMILDDDHAGIFHFEEKETSVPESIGEYNLKVVRSSGARGRVMIPYRTIEGTARGGGVDYDDANGELIFENDETEGIIKVRIIDDEEYEKNETFYVEIGEPQLLRRGSVGDLSSLVKFGNEGKQIDENPEKRMDGSGLEDLGKPRVGDITKISIHIQESTEFKSTVDKLLKKANLSLVVGTSSWREQFVEAITVSSGDDDDDGGDEEGEEMEERLPSCMDYVMHFLSLFWKVLFACVPPTDIWGGWACFVVSILGIGGLTAVMGDLASGFGCTIGLKDSVTAITFVALGTSLPDTFASKVAAIGDEYADSSVGNVTGSNAVNVFLGIGIAWTMAAIYHAFNKTKFTVEPGSLAFSVTIFCVLAAIAIIMMVVRRNKKIGGELGGPKIPKMVTSSILCVFWMIYILLSSLEGYCHIQGF